MPDRPLGSLVPDAVDHERRIIALEKEQNAIRRDMAIAEVRREHIDTRFDRLEQALSKLVWLVVGGFVSGGVAFIMTGGMSGV